MNATTQVNVVEEFVKGWNGYDLESKDHPSAVKYYRFHAGLQAVAVANGWQPSTKERFFHNAVFFRFYDSSHEHQPNYYLLEQDPAAGYQEWVKRLRSYVELRLTNARHPFKPIVPGDGFYACYPYLNRVPSPEVLEATALRLCDTRIRKNNKGIRKSSKRYQALKTEMFPQCLEDAKHTAIRNRDETLEILNRGLNNKQEEVDKACTYFEYLVELVDQFQWFYPENLAETRNYAAECKAVAVANQLARLKPWKEAIAELQAIQY